MTESEIRKKVIETALKYMGAREGGSDHRHIVDVFNTVKPDGGAMTIYAPWCACFVSAIEIEALGIKDAKKICPLSYNCGTIISKAKSMGIWIESDAHTPEVGDWILYDWQDSGKGDNTGSPDHVGLVEKVTKKQIYVIEGNKNDRVERRILQINGRYIRGFVAVPYSKIAQKEEQDDPQPQKPVKKKVKVGSRIKIRNGANQYGTTRRFLPKVYKTIYKVIEINGSRVVFATTDGKTVIGAVNKRDCIAQ